MNSIPSPQLISLHGGHSGDFCQHADNSLEEIVRAYIDRGFGWVGITEHAPPPSDGFLYPDEKDAGLTSDLLQQRFHQYMATCRLLQKKYAAQIDILVGFETEGYTGASPFTIELVHTYRPDFIVGSIHHVNDVNFDYDAAFYRQAAATAGGVDALYLQYFDAQYELITTLRPPVIGHFDLVRIYDGAYQRRLLKPDIEKRIDRNLHAIKRFGLFLDLNVRAIQKGASEPYVSRPILLKALSLGIPVVPGDDAHSVAEVGRHVKDGVRLLGELGFSVRWQELVGQLKRLG